MAKPIMNITYVRILKRPIKRLRPLRAAKDQSDEDSAMIDLFVIIKTSIRIRNINGY